MHVQQGTWTSGTGWSWPAPAQKADLVLLFGGRDGLQQSDALTHMADRYPGASLAGCSTAGEIHGAQVDEDSLVATAVTFDDATVACARVHVRQGDDHATGARLAGKLAPEGLRHVLVFSDGLHVNGSDLVAGIRSALPPDVQVTGGLAGDGDRFETTWTLCGDRIEENAVVAVGLYGDSLRIGHGSLGGWDPFGPRRRVTRSAGNVLYELDGRPALALYREYLGDQADGLPATGLLFPLSVQHEGWDGELVRTILGIDEEDQSLTFAGDIPQGSMAQLMKANFDRLVDGAHDAAGHSADALGSSDAQLALLISCVGRRLVLGQRVEEELEAVQEVLGAATPLAGFYSYGEICPSAPGANCELHNQTMTITTLREG